MLDNDFLTGGVHVTKSVPLTFDDAAERFTSVETWNAFHAIHKDLEALDAFIVDVNGLFRGKRLPIADAARVFTTGVQFSACAPLLDCRGLSHNPCGIGNSDGDPDATAWPVADRLCAVPWAATPTAQVLCTMRDVESGQPLWFDPRVALENVVKKCHADEMYPVVACELEFYLVEPQSAACRRPVPINPSGRFARAANLSLEALEDAAPMLQAITHAARLQGVPASTAVVEYGAGQYEVNLRHVADPLDAADHATLLRRIVRAVARSHGMDATFMAKPFLNQPGNGLHVHVSLTDRLGRNRFGEPGGDSLLRSAIAGMQATMHDASAFFAPNFNSHRRYGGPFTPETTGWGYNNRSVAFRVPVERGAATRIEHRVAGADASPHLVIAAILAGLHIGVTNQWAASAPTIDKAPAGGDAKVHSGLLAALERLQDSESLARYLPTRLLRAYAELKRSEYASLFAAIVEPEYDLYF